MENFPAHVQDTGAASESARDELSKAETAYQNVLVIDKQNPELPLKKFPARINLGITLKMPLLQRGIPSQVRRVNALSAERKEDF